MFFTAKKESELQNEMARRKIWEHRVNLILKKFKGLQMYKQVVLTR